MLSVIFISNVTFLILLFYTFDEINPKTQWLINDQIDWNLFFSIMIWIHTGWDGISTISHMNIKKTSYTKGLFIANLLVLSCNIIPIMLGLTYDQNSIHWHDGYLITICKSYSTVLGFACSYCRFNYS